MIETCTVFPRILLNIVIAAIAAMAAQPYLFRHHSSTAGVLIWKLSKPTASLFGLNSMNRYSYRRKKNLAIGCIYRSPSSYINEFCLALNDTLHALSSERKNAIIMGDININLFENNSPCNEYKNCLNGHGFECIVAIPTRCVDNGQGTLIDHALSNLITPPSAGVLEVSITDHYPVFVRIREKEREIIIYWRV